MNYSLQLRIGSIFEIIVISCLGVYTPILITRYYHVFFPHDTSLIDDKRTSNSALPILATQSKVPQKDKLMNVNLEMFMNTRVYRLFKSFAGGLVLSVAFVHLLADSIEDLSDNKFLEITNGYPLSMVLALSGIVLLVCIEQLTVVALHYVSNSKIGNHVECHDIHQNDLELNHHHVSHVNTYEDSQVPQHSITVLHDHSTESNVVKDLLKLAIFEASIAVHSIIIGYNLGNLSGESSTSTIRDLMIALAFHQYFEGFALGTMMSELKLSNIVEIIIVAIFSFTTPFGIIIGIFTINTSTGDYVKGITNAFAAGLIIYAGLVEITMEEFEKPVKNEIVEKPLMCLSLCLGALFMAILAIWA